MRNPFKLMLVVTSIFTNRFLPRPMVINFTLLLTSIAFNLFFHNYMEIKLMLLLRSIDLIGLAYIDKCFRCLL
jgi:hypothetical protein